MARSLVPRSWFDDLPRSLFRDLTELYRDVDTLFEGAFGRGRGAADDASPWWPSAESYVKDGKLAVRLDLPGVDPKDVEVSLTGDTLTIRGERRGEKADEGKGYVAREVRYGSFERTMMMPEGIDPESIHARYTNGVLEVTLPLPARVVPRKVPIGIQVEKKVA